MDNIGSIFKGSDLVNFGLTQAGNAINSKRQWRYAQKQMALQQQYALEQMDKQAQLQREYFDYQNAYNTPSEVMKRFRVAGISPAAVLGSSGAQVGATISSGGTFGASGPSAGSPGYGAAVPLYTGLAQSEINQREAAAYRDRMEGNKLQGETHSSEFRERMDELSLLAGDLANKEAKVRIDILTAQSVIANNDQQLSTWSLGYKFEQVYTELEMLKTQAHILQEQAPALGKQAEASYLATLTTAYLNSQSADAEAARSKYLGEQTNLTMQQVLNMKSFITLNWNTKFKVDVLDAKGKVTDTREMTLQEMYAYMTVNEAEASTYLAPSARFRMRSEKNALGYAILNTLTKTLGAAAILAASSKKGAPVPTGYEQEETYVDPNGEVIGGKSVVRKKTY